MNTTVHNSSNPVWKYLRLKQVLQHVPVSASTWWAWVKIGRAPKQIKLSEGVSVWREDQIHAFINQEGFGG